MNRLLRLDFLPRSYDLALLLLRVWIGFSLFYRHGIEKITNFSAMAAHFPNPVHIGPHASLAMALISDAVCSILVVIGLVTRLAALYIVVIIGTAFVFIHHLSMSPPHGSEIAYAYLGVFLTIFIAGPGRFSVDGAGTKGKKVR